MGLAQPKQRKDKPVVGDIRNLNNHWKDSVAPLSPAYKMLQKMGWKDGKGLGRNEEGHTEHIKIKLKTDATGIGSHELPRSEDNWLAHTDAFNDILSQLNVQIAPDNADSKINVSDSEVESKVSSTPAFGRLAHRAKFLKAKQEATSDTSNHIHIFGQSSTSISVNQTVVNQVSETLVCEVNEVITENNHKKEKSKKSKSSKKDNKISKKLKKSKKARAHKCEQS